MFLPNITLISKLYSNHKYKNTLNKFHLESNENI